MTLALPIIDISALKSDNQSEWKEVIKAIDGACRDTGFFYVTGHGIPAQQFTKVQAMAEKFFALPEEIKQKDKHTAFNESSRLGTGKRRKTRPKWP
ncbi:2-oxoglutarate and iron-dependent oxygenase domain-containing protein [Psychromonas sp. KJ10-10]|uniref:2-oxoglutarate and iron-dependent oxygenase domain-containing protein n=1 Tax=Psychromonas sp. KJ10-10 TaxID=3391823 RepID=UPI0039B37E86